MPAPNHPTEVTALYADRCLRARAALEALERRSLQVSNARGVSFAAGAVALGIAVLGDAGARPVAGAVAAAGALAFAVLVVAHARVIEREQAARAWLQVNERALQRVGDEWRSLPDTGADLPSGAHPFSEDLDVVGPGSLFQRISVARTEAGRRALWERLGDTEPSVVRARAQQAAVRALAPLLDFRQQLEALGVVAVGPVRKGGATTATTGAFLSWAEDTAELPSGAALRVAAWLLPALNLAGLLGWAVGLLPAAAWALPALASTAVLVRTQAGINRAFVATSVDDGGLRRYGAMLELYERCEARAPLLDETRERLMSGALRPSRALGELERLVGWFGLKHNGLIHPVINLVLLWDVHCTLGLDAWKRRAGGVARQWLAALGELEALSSLAGLAHDEPEFGFPELTEEPGVFAAEALGHPLLRHDRRVANDFALGGPGRGHLITGSNMSGKSTFLRSIGLAVVLGLAGGPVAARRLRLSAHVLRTSLRIKDSLQGGASHFFAEVLALKRAVDSAAAGQPVLFLLDEVLHGTNSRERQLGARWVLAELLRLQATGVVTTHDIELCRLPEPLMAQVTQCHFRETMSDGAMSFDYRLRPGPVTSGNALRLMRGVGLGVPLEDQPG